MPQDSRLHLDLMPDDTRVGSRLMCQMFGKSRATLWRMVNAGVLPPPTKLTPNSRPDWRLGDARKALKAKPATAE